jgi:hypothetical protein
MPTAGPALQVLLIPPSEIRVKNGGARSLAVRAADALQRIGPMNFKMLAIVLGAVAAFDTTGLAASAADNVRVRGTVDAFEGSTLTVKTREGATEAIVLAAGWKISGIAPASASDIKVGDFLGVASAPTADGSSGALEVVIFPAALRGAGEGDRPWDLQPGSSMTNGTVGDEVTGVDGPTITLTYQGGERKVAIPASTPIVTIASAEPADLVPGAGVFVTAERGADGKLTAGRVVVGNHGVAPPM